MTYWCLERLNLFLDRLASATVVFTKRYIMGSVINYACNMEGFLSPNLVNVYLLTEWEGRTENYLP